MNECCLTIETKDLEKIIEMSDLFEDQGVIKTVIRASTEVAKPKRGDEVALTYTVLSGVDSHVKSLVYTVGTNLDSLFIPLQTLDRIVCDMKRNEKCEVVISSEYSGSGDTLRVELTLVHLKPAQTSESSGLGALAPPLGDFQSHLLRNPDVMEQMISSPYMQSLLANPETLRSLIGTNPQMQQLMEQNPELRHLLSDPDFLQQSMEAMRNPSVMREMMRSTDRAMSNLESIPGGSAALHKLYNEVQEPLFEASRGVGDSSSSSVFKKVYDETQLKAKYGEMAKPGKPFSEPMANPWANAPTFPSTVPPSQTTSIDYSGMGQMMQDPAMQQLMASMFRSNQAAHPSSTVTPFQDASFLQQLFNPTSIQAMAGLEQSIAGLQGNPSQLPVNGFNAMFGNFITAAQNDPATRYASQLATLRSMGFTDTQAAINALDRCGGDLSRAIDFLTAQRDGAHSSHK